MVKHIKQNFKRACANFDDAKILSIVRKGIALAGNYQILSQHDVCMFVDLIMVFGADFDTNPEFPWAKETLNDPSIKNASDKVERLYVEAENQLRTMSQLSAEEK